MADATTLGGILRHVRHAAGHTLEDVRVRLGGRWTLTAVSRAERDADDEPPAGYVAAFCDAYGVELTGARFSFERLAPMTVSLTPRLTYHADGTVTAEPITPAAELAAVLSSLFPDGPAALSFGDDELDG